MTIKTFGDWVLFRGKLFGIYLAVLCRSAERAKVEEFLQGIA